MPDNVPASQPSFDPLEGVQAGGPAGAIPLVYGHPDPDLLLVEKIITATERALRARGRLALQYGPERGYGPLLDYLIGKVERDEGLLITRANVMLCAGAAQGLDTAPAFSLAPATWCWWRPPATTRPSPPCGPPRGAETGAD